MYLSGIDGALKLKGINMKRFGLILASALAIPLLVTNANAKVKKYGVTVDNCGFDYDDEDFCTDKRLKTYAQVLKTRKPNFDKDKILYIFQSSGPDMGYRIVLMDTKTKMVSPMMHSFSEASDSRGNLVKVNSKGDNLEFDFNVNSNKFCFKGNISAYRDAYDYESGPFCYRYDPKFKELSRDF